MERYEIVELESNVIYLVKIWDSLDESEYHRNSRNFSFCFSKLCKGAEVCERIASISSKNFKLPPKLIGEIWHVGWDIPTHYMIDSDGKAWIDGEEPIEGRDCDLLLNMIDSNGSEQEFVEAAKAMGIDRKSKYEISREENLRKEKILKLVKEITDEQCGSWKYGIIVKEPLTNKAINNLKEIYFILNGDKPLL